MNNTELARAPEGALGFPSPFRITVGVSKGGTGKSWLALNLASWLGFQGYDVCAVDMNQKHDLARDHWELMNHQRLYPRFDALEHTPLVWGADRQRFVQAAPLDLAGQAHRQFVVFDTSQYVELDATARAWRECHLMLMPVTPTTADRWNFRDSLQAFRAFGNPRPPLLAVPCRVRVLKNSTPQRQFEDLLAYLESEGCVVPNFPSDQQIPESELMMSQHTRWVLNEVRFGERPKALNSNFLLRVERTFQWIKDILEAHYGPLPKPLMPPLPFFGLGKVNKQLAYECMRKQGLGHEAALAALKAAPKAAASEPVTTGQPGGPFDGAAGR